MNEHDEQLSLFSMMNNVGNIELTSEIIQDEITAEVSKVFDYDFEGKITEVISIPVFPKDFEIGVIVGNSGSGKTTILNRVFGKEEHIEWDNTKSIASHFTSFQEASERFGAVGLNSIPTWLKPYQVLSNGEKFRADMARRLKDDAVIDEFTSVVNRDTAISCSISIEKYIRSKKMKRIVFSTCHEDVLPYLSPSWIYNTNTHEFHNGRYLQRPKLHLKVHSCDKSLWNLFKRYHYLTADLNESARCYTALHNGRPIAFLAVLPLYGGSVSNAWREHRIVVLPDYQGRGIGNKLSEVIAQGYWEMGYSYYSKAANPRIGEHRERSRLWKRTAHNLEKRDVSHTNPYFNMSKELIAIHNRRICYAHRYIGDGSDNSDKLKSHGKDDFDGQMSIFDIGCSAVQ